MSPLSLVAGAAFLAMSATAALAQTQEGAAPAAQAQAATPAQPATYTDAQLQAFIAASTEIDPISRSLPSADDAQRTAATEQIRGALERNNIDSATYNAIAAQAQGDAAFAARINDLRPAAPAEAEAPPAQPQ